MFKRPLILASMVIIAGIGSFLYRFHEITDDDRQAYNELTGDNESDASVPQKVKQTRHQVSKDIYFNDNDQQRHVHLEGNFSELLLAKEGDSTTLVENITPMVCSYQMEVDPNNLGQSVIWLDAAHAKLNYKSQILDAGNIHIYNYRLVGSELPLKRPDLPPVLAGAAEHATLSIEEKSPRLEVLQFKGRLWNEENKIILAADSGIYSKDEFHFDGDVNIAFKQDGVLHCEKAEIDNKSHKARFSTPENQGQVVYTDIFVDKLGKKAPIQFKSQLLQIEFSPDNPKPLIARLEAEHLVTLIYNNDLTLKGAHAEYTFQKDPEKPQTLVSGIIVLTPGETGELCRMSNSQGDYISAEQMELNTLDSSISMQHPQGSLQTKRANAISTPLSFNADSLIWLHQKDKLILNKNAAVTDFVIGTLSTDESLVLQRKTAPNGSKILQTIQSSGNSLLTHTESDKKLTHTLSCHGRLVLDHEKGIVNATTLPGNPQIAFEDSMGAIYADRATMTYEKKGESVVPKKLLLEGHLQIVNHIPEAATKNRFALADHAEYIFATKELNLTALPKQRVLFFDKNNHFEISAPGLKIKRDAATGEDTIKGVGDVRFNLIEHELDQIRSHFQFESQDKEE